MRSVQRERARSVFLGRCKVGAVLVTPQGRIVSYDPFTTFPEPSAKRGGYPWQRRLNALRAMQRRRWLTKHPEGPSRFMRDFMRDLRFIDRRG